MSTNQDIADPNSHIMYQTFAAYPATQTMGTWGQPASQQSYTFAPYPQSDRASYTDTTTYSNQQYQPVPYGGGGDSGDYYRSSGYYAQQPANQWQASSYPTFNAAPSNQPLFGTSTYSANDRDQPRANTYSAATAQLPNMSQPPPNIKRENGGNTFQASLSMLETPAQASAAYTASWVSNTTAIPPDLKEEPEIFTGLTRDDIGSTVFSPPNFADQFGGLSLAGDTVKNDKKIEERRPPRQLDPAPKELTWEERIRKANVQKERAEQRGSVERATMERERPERENARGGGRGSRPNGTGGRGNGQQRDSRDNRQQRNNVQSGMMWKNENGEKEHDSNYQNKPNRPNNIPVLPGIMRGPEVPLMLHPGLFIPGQPHMMMPPRGMPFMGQPRYMGNVQDERFKNTWLDATAYAFPMPFAPMPFAMDNRGFRGGRGRGRGGYRGGGRGGDYQKRYNDKKDQEQRSEDQSQENSSAPGAPSENNTSVSPVAGSQSTA